MHTSSRSVCDGAVRYICAGCGGVVRGAMWGAVRVASEGEGLSARGSADACPGSLPALLQVRAVSRRQFFVRTLGNKVAVAQQQQQEQQRHQRPQQQQQQAPRPGGAPGGVQRTLSAGRPVSLPVGDSWARTGLLPPSGGGGGGGGGW